MDDSEDVTQSHTHNLFMHSKKSKKKYKHKLIIKAVSFSMFEVLALNKEFTVYFTFFKP